MINDTNTKRYLCKYKPSNLIFIVEDEKIEMDATNILSIEYLTDYEFNLRAILKIVLRMDIRKKLWILKNKRNIICKFEFNKIGMDIDTEVFITSPEQIWNQEFCIYLNDEDESIDTAVMEERIAKNENAEFRSNDIETENYYESQNVVPIYLFNKELLDASNKIYNEIYTKNTVQQFVGRLLTKTKHTNVLMSKCENNEVYQEILIPARPAYKGLVYLDQYFGLYKKGAMIFYDIDTLYILNTDGNKVTAKREDEWAETTFLISRLDQSIPGNGMVRKEGEKVNYISLSEMDINPQKFTITNNEFIGSEAKVVITDDITINIEDADQSYIKQRNENITYAHKSDNKFNANIIKARMEENELIFYINGENFDITSFTPNKVFQLVFDETSKQERFGKYKYRITYAYHFFLIESEGYMTASSRICLKKCSSN
jgi:hypothetical protein